MTKTRNKIKIMSLFLALVMMIGSLSVFSVTASAADDITVNTSGCEGKLGVALQSLQGLRDLS